MPRANQNGKAKKSFGKHLKKLRDDAGLSQFQVAHKVQVSIQTIYGWEHGRVTPHPSRMAPLARALGVKRTVLDDYPR